MKNFKFTSDGLTNLNLNVSQLNGLWGYAVDGMGNYLTNEGYPYYKLGLERCENFNYLYTFL